MKAWLKNEDDADDEEVWGYAKKNYTFTDLVEWLEKRRVDSSMDASSDKDVKKSKGKNKNKGKRGEKEKRKEIATVKGAGSSKSHK